MNVKCISLTPSIFAVVLSILVISDTQATTTALTNPTLTKTPHLVLAKAKIRKVRNKIKAKSRIKKKHARKDPIRTCDSYSSKILRKKAAKYQADINQLAKQNNVPPQLIMAIITVESCFRKSARSPQGAAGLMQLIPATASRFGTRDRYNTYQNIKAGTRYLKFLLKRFDGNLKLVAAAYNAGEGAVKRHKGIPPYKETRAYVTKVLNAYNKLSRSMPKNKRIIAKKIPSAWPLRLIQQKNLTELIDARTLAFTTPEWKQMAKILMPQKVL